MTDNLTQPNTPEKMNYWQIIAEIDANYFACLPAAGVGESHV